MLLILGGIHPNPGPPLPLHVKAIQQKWEESMPAIRLDKTTALNRLSLLRLPWRSTPLGWDVVKQKKTGIRQSTEHDVAQSGFYVKCSDACISVLDFDSDKPAALELMEKIAGRCNLVALSPKGVHLFFTHEPRLRRGFSRPDLGFDIRTYDSGASDIILVEPSAYTKTMTDGTVEQARYTWLVTPRLLQQPKACPPDIVDFISAISMKVKKSPDVKQSAPEDPTLRVIPPQNKPKKVPLHERLDAPRRSDHTQPPPRAPVDALEIASWNMNRQATGTMAELLTHMRTIDVIALQETGSTEAWTEQLPDFHVFVTEGHCGLNTALIVRKHIFSSLHQLHVDMPEGSTVTSVSCTTERGVRLGITIIYISPNPHRFGASVETVLQRIVANTRS
eukprot:PhM_4_TR16760/c3_g2_i2/m.75198